MGTARRLLALSGVLAGVAWASAGAEDAAPDLNQKILEFARGSLGRKVGSGQCTSLAREALRHAGARSRISPDDGPDADFAWGRRVATLTPKDHPTADIHPGDLVQLRDVKIIVRSRVRVGSRIGTRTETWTYPHHTAIVSAVSRRALTVLHQNFGPGGATDEEKQVVREDTLRLDGLKAGTLWVYRPVAECEAIEPTEEGEDGSTR